MFQSEKNPTKMGIKWGTFSFPLCHTIETRKTNVNTLVQDGESADTDLSHTDAVQLIGSRFLLARMGDVPFPDQV